MRANKLVYVLLSLEWQQTDKPQEHVDVHLIHIYGSTYFLVLNIISHDIFYSLKTIRYILHKLIFFLQYCE